MGEIKQANFRIDTETAAQFREFCEANGLNQAQGFDHIMQVAEMDKAKTTLPKRATEIEEFERHTKNLITAYLNSLEIAESTEERILEQFQSRLESKDEQIMKLQAEVKEKEELATAANTAALELQNTMEIVEKAAREASENEKKAMAALKDKEEINSMLTGKLKDAELQLTDYPEMQKKLDTVNAELTSALQTIRDNEKDAEIAVERAAADKERALVAVEKAHQEELQKLYEKIEQVREERADLKDALSSEKQENRELRAELEALKKKLAE
jgi:chromosome segregation ATPase